MANTYDIRKRRVRHLASSLTLVLLFAALFVSCSSGRRVPTFYSVYKDMLAIADNPERMNDSILAETKLPKLWDKTNNDGYVEWRTVIYGLGTAVSDTDKTFSYHATDAHAFALRFKMGMDPQIYIDFRNQSDALWFYKSIVDFGMVEDKFHCRFVTDRHLTPGVTKVDDLSQYARTIGVQMPKRTSFGWYTIAFGN